MLARLSLNLIFHTWWKIPQGWRANEPDSSSRQHISGLIFRTCLCCVYSLSFPGHVGESNPSLSLIAHTVHSTSGLELPEYLICHAFFFFFYCSHIVWSCKWLHGCAASSVGSRQQWGRSLLWSLILAWFYFKIKCQCQLHQLILHHKWEQSLALSLWHVIGWMTERSAANGSSGAPSDRSVVCVNEPESWSRYQSQCWWMTPAPGVNALSQTRSSVACHNPACVCAWVFMCCGGHLCVCSC